MNETDALTFDSYFFGGSFGGNNSSYYTDLDGARAVVGAFNQFNVNTSTYLSQDYDLAFRRQGKPNTPQLTAELDYNNNYNFFNFFICGYTVDVPGPDDLRAEGDLFDHEYEFRRGGQVVATVTKRWFSWADTYGVEVAPGEDDVLILASTVVIEMACHKEKGD